MTDLTSAARALGVAAFAITAASCATDDMAMSEPMDDMDAASVDLLANGLDGFDEVGGANWTYADSVLEASSGDGVGFLFTPDAYDDFEIAMEFYVSEEHNSGVYFRCSDMDNISDSSCYEANIFDDRPDQSGRTGAVPNYLPPIEIVDSAGQWNTYVVRAEGDRITITLNGVTTVDGQDPTHASGPIGLQWGAGVVRFRNVTLTPL